ncbi:hypothetical protein HQ529_03590 [Candidatus Woesearchaeota archaeon]|nr:hypothetical protein [Candidatus Woesearchaeota archaeon]
MRNRRKLKERKKAFMEWSEYEDPTEQMKRAFITGFNMAWKLCKKIERKKVADETLIEIEKLKDKFEKKYNETKEQNYFGAHQGLKWIEKWIRSKIL